METPGKFAKPDMCLASFCGGFHLYDSALTRT